MRTRRLSPEVADDTAGQCDETGHAFSYNVPGEWYEVLWRKCGQMRLTVRTHESPAQPEG